MSDKNYNLKVTYDSNKTSLEEDIALLEKLVSLKIQASKTMVLIPDTESAKLAELLDYQKKYGEAANEVKKIIKEKNNLTDEELTLQIKLGKENQERKKELADLVVLGDKEAGTLDKLAAANRRLSAERSKLNLTTSEGKKRLAEINTQLDKNNKTIKESNDALGKQRLNIGNYKSALEGLPGPLGAASQSVSWLNKQLLALLANPIVAVIAAIAGALYGLFKAFTSTDKGATEFEARMEQVSAVIDVVRQRADTLASSLVSVFKGDYGSAAASFGLAIAGASDQIKQATSAAYEYTYAIDAIKDAEIGYISERAKAANKIAKLEFLSADQSKVVGVRRKALQEAIAISEEESKKEIEFAKRTFDAEVKYSAAKNKINENELRQFIAADDERQEFLLKNSADLRRVRNNINDEGQEALEKSFSKQVEAETKFFEENKRNNSKLSGFEKDERDKRKEALKKQLDLEKDLRDARIRNIQSDYLRERAAQEEATATSLAKIKSNSATAEELRRQLKIENNNKLLEIDKKYFTQSEEYLRQYEENKRAIEKAAREEEEEAFKKGIEDGNKSQEERFKANLLKLKKDSKEYRDEQIDQIKFQRDFELSNALLTNNQRVIIEKEAQEKIDAINQKGLQKQLQTIDFATAKIAEAAKKQSDARISAIDKDIAAQQKDVEAQKLRAEQGLSNTLEFEQKKAAELEAQRQKEFEKQKRREKALAFYNLFSGYAKIDASTALKNTARDIAISEAITLAFAEKGGIVGDIGETTTLAAGSLSKSHKSGRDHLVVAEAGEGMLSLDMMNKIGGPAGFHKMAHLIDGGYMTDGVMFEKQPIITAVPVHHQNNKELIRKIDSLIEVTKNKPVSNTSLDNMGNVITEMIEGNNRKLIKKMSKQPGFRK